MMDFLISMLYIFMPFPIGIIIGLEKENDASIKRKFFLFAIFAALYISTGVVLKINCHCGSFFLYH